MMITMDLSLGGVIQILILGLIAGFIIHLMDRREVKGGLMATAVTGVVGAILGGLIAQLVLGVGISGLNLTSVAIAVGGGLILSFIQRMVTGTKEETIQRLGRERDVAYFSQVQPLSEDERGRSALRSKSYSSGKMVNPVIVERYLKDVDYPASLGKLIRAAEEQGADNDVLFTLGQLPDKEFRSPTQISEELGKLE